jgi:hypothetical protein
VVDGEEDATFARPARTKEALPSPDGIAENNTFFTPLFTIKNAYKTSFFGTKRSYILNPAALAMI